MYIFSSFYYSNFFFACCFVSSHILRRHRCVKRAFPIANMTHNSFFLPFPYHTTRVSKT